MKKNYLSVITGLLLSTISLAQSWNWAKPADTSAFNITGNCLESCGGSGFYLGLDYADNNGLAVESRLIKFNGQGSEVWRQRMIGRAEINGITCDTEKVLIVGTFSSWLYIGSDTLASYGMKDVFVAA